jgi:hypothetical protein
MSRKYAVLKWSDWEEFVIKAVVQAGIMPEAPILVDDAEVVRKQDLTSAPIFYLYSNLVRSYIDLVGPNLSPDHVVALIEIADHFHEAGLDADEWPGKRLPD